MARQAVSQIQLARTLNWAQSQLSRRLNGAIFFRTDELERIAQALGIPVSQLMNVRALAS